MKKEMIISNADSCFKYLCKIDPNLKKLLNIIGTYRLILQEDYYESLVKRIISQQLSLNAANTIITRVMGVCTKITPDTINATTNNELSNCGVSKQKIIYIRDLTEKIRLGILNIDKLSYEDDETVIELLTQIKGIGIWTAEMFLIFSLGRKNILSLRDISI